MNDDGPTFEAEIAPEAGCNCRHLADGARCVHCQERETTAGPQLWHDDDQDDDGPDPVLLTDGSGCWWCESSTDYHPVCDAPGCENDTHGHGPAGKTVSSYCDGCASTAIVTDGGHPVTHECANCGAKYRDPKAADQCCVSDLLTDGGTRAPRSRPETSSDAASAAVVDALETRVEDVEDRVGEREDVAKDLVAIFNRLEDRVDELEQRVEDLEGDR